MNRNRVTPGLLAGIGAAGMVWAGCAGSGAPTPTRRIVPGSGIPATHPPDKVDILFDIDNSSSMADKQRYLAAAVGDLLTRLIDPNCVDPFGNVAGPSMDGACKAGFAPEFPPVHDLHLGVVTSSLGPRGGDVCSPTASAPPPFANVSAHDDDQGHLIDRTLTFSADGSSVTEGVVADAPASDPYLYWFPTSENVGATPGPGRPIASTTSLAYDFNATLTGAGEFGCGIESQLESWYRFLIQPDPYASITAAGPPGDATGQWTGVDATILAQRHDFLRPDSLVLIVDLTDENDSEIDIRSMGGLAVNWMDSTFVPPRGTSPCATNPASAACQSCEQGAGASTDPACTAAPSPGGDGINLRHVHMKARYGVDLQFPIERYVTGLASTVVPARNGEYPAGATSYAGMNDCQNPLYSGQLPDGSKTDPNTLCHSPPGPRTKDTVFYAHIGGVPSQLLHFAPGNPDASALTDADWVKILGTDPEHYDYTGIDPRMVESFSDVRPGQAPDLAYACTFPLADATGSPTSATATAYPTVRELLLARKMGRQGIASSICPIDVTDNATADDPLYGYRPAVEGIVDRLKPLLSNACLPQAILPNPDGTIECLILLEVPGGGAGTSGTCLHPECPKAAGLQAPSPAVPSSFCDDLEQAYQQEVASQGESTAGLTDPANVPVCQVAQLTPAANPTDFQASTCAAGADKGWCYVTGAGAGRCPQAIVFTPGTVPQGAVSNLECVDPGVMVLADGG